MFLVFITNIFNIIYLFVSLYNLNFNDDINNQLKIIIEMW